MFEYLYFLYISVSGYLRFIYLIFISIVYLIPAWFAWIHGHGRFGKTGVFDTLDLDKPDVVVFWILTLPWFLMPFLRLIYFAIFDKGED